MQHDKPQHPSSMPDRVSSLAGGELGVSAGCNPAGLPGGSRAWGIPPSTGAPSTGPRRWLWGLLAIAAFVPLLATVGLGGVFLVLNNALEARVTQVMREIGPEGNDRSSATSTLASMDSSATLDLAPLLIKSGDLPPEHSARTPTSTLPPMFQALPLPRAEQQLDQRFLRGNKVAGGVTAFRFAAQAGDAYELLAAQLASDAAKAGMKATPVREVGEHALASLVFPKETNTYDLVFQRGCVMAYIRLGQVESINDLIAYAKRLDQRLRLVVCG